MLYLELENGKYPVSEGEIRYRLHDQAADLPVVADRLTFLAHGFEGVIATPQPIAGEGFEAVETAPVRGEDGIMRQAWVLSVIDYTQPANLERHQRALTAAVQTHMDRAAAKLGYDDIRSAITYATSTHPKFGPEGVAFRDWRDAVWTRCYEVLAEVQAGTRPVPMSYELIAELPALVLPTATDGGANV